MAPVSGTRPIFAKAWMNDAWLDAKTKSHAKARLAPAPAATPFTAATTGFGIRRRARTNGL